MIKNTLFELNFNVGDIFYYGRRHSPITVNEMGTARRYPKDSDGNTLIRVSFILGVGLLYIGESSIRYFDGQTWWLEYNNCRKNKERQYLW